MYLTSIEAKAKQILKVYDKDKKLGYEYLVRGLIGSARRAIMHYPSFSKQSKSISTDERAEVASRVANTYRKSIVIRKQQQMDFYGKVQEKFKILQKKRNA